jgi:hypothetical protein
MFKFILNLRGLNPTKTSKYNLQETIIIGFRVQHFTFALKKRSSSSYWSPSKSPQCSIQPLCGAKQTEHTRNKRQMSRSDDSLARKERTWQHSAPKSLMLGRVEHRRAQRNFSWSRHWKRLEVLSGRWYLSVAFSELGIYIIIVLQNYNIKARNSVLRRFEDATNMISLSHGKTTIKFRIQFSDQWWTSVVHLYFVCITIDAEKCIVSSRLLFFYFNCLNKYLIHLKGVNGAAHN